MLSICSEAAFCAPPLSEFCTDAIDSRSVQRLTYARENHKQNLSLPEHLPKGREECKEWRQQHGLKGV